jgi:hypothetical protein
MYQRLDAVQKIGAEKKSSPHVVRVVDFAERVTVSIAGTGVIVLLRLLSDLVA